MRRLSQREDTQSKPTEEKHTPSHRIRTHCTKRQYQPQPVQTRSGKRYANIAVDEATRWAWVTLLRSLKHTTERALEPLLGTKLKGQTRIFGSDPGTEFLNGKVDALLKQLRIERQLACADDQSQNGLPERTIGVLFEIMRTILFHKNYLFPSGASSSSLPATSGTVCLRVQTPTTRHHSKCGLVTHPTCATSDHSESDVRCSNTKTKSRVTKQNPVA